MKFLWDVITWNVNIRYECFFKLCPLISHCSGHLHKKKKKKFQAYHSIIDEKFQHVITQSVTPLTPMQETIQKKFEILWDVMIQNVKSRHKCLFIIMSPTPSQCMGGIQKYSILSWHNWNFPKYYESECKYEMWMVF